MDNGECHILCINTPTGSVFSVFYMHDNKILTTTAILMDRTGNLNGQDRTDNIMTSSANSELLK
jgi:hypothetical protein